MNYDQVPPPKPDMPMGDDDNIPIDDEWPEITAIINIIERARLFSSEEQCTVRLSIQVELTGMPERQVKEKYIVASAPGNAKTLEEFNKQASQIKDIVNEEMNAAFPGTVEDVSDKTEDKDRKHIVETLTELVDPEITEQLDHPSKPLTIPPAIEITDLPNLISLKNLKNE